MKYERKIIMRIVNSLNQTNKCPNCGSQFPVLTMNEFGRPLKRCLNCNEEIYENETTCDEETVVVGKAPDDVDDSLMNLEYEISSLTRLATNKDELEQLERIRDIFDELVSVIRRIK